MVEIEITQATLDSLAAKLATLDLNADEYAALESVFAAADVEAEVTGFGASKFGSLLDVILIPPPSGPVPVPYPNTGSTVELPPPKNPHRPG